MPTDGHELPGYKLIQNGEYEILDAKNTKQVISQSTWERIQPGISLKQAVSVYRRRIKGVRCPNRKCLSEQFEDFPGGGKTWYVWHKSTQTYSIEALLA